MKVGSLFSGIGGLDLGLEWAGMEVVWQVENEPYCQRVLEKHWPHVRRYSDVKETDPHELEEVDLICAGFPCQPVSFAGKRLAQDDPRWLWPEVDRFVRVLRPRYVLLENVPGLLSAGMSDVLGDLAACGYDAEWDCIPAAAVGAPHRRDRVWIVAHRDSYGSRVYPGAVSEGARNLRRRKAGYIPSGRGEVLADASSGHGRSGGPGGSEHGSQGIRKQAHQSAAVADAEVNTERPGLCEGEQTSERRGRSGDGGSAGDVSDAGCLTDGSLDNGGAEKVRGATEGDEGERRTVCSVAGWATEPDVGRVANGVPARVDRLRGLGNAVVPQMAEWIGRWIMEVDE